MRNRNTTTEPHPQSIEVAKREKDRAASYGRMTRDDYVETVPAQPKNVVVAPNGRPYDPNSGRYIDR
jgi:hypothetical protein